MTPDENDQDSISEALVACLEATSTVSLCVTAKPDEELERALSAHCSRSGGKMTIARSPRRTEDFNQLKGADAWLLPDLHNYYTAYHQIHGLSAMCRKAGKPLLLFVPHLQGSIRWRDFYRWDECIPAEWRHEIEQVRLDAGPQFNEPMFAASHEGGLRNGVVTALHDACDELIEMGVPVVEGHVAALAGLSVIFDNTASWAAALSSELLRFRDDPLRSRHRHGS